MFTEEHLLLIFQYIFFIFAMPPILILLLDRLVSYLAKDAFAVYSATGIVGAPLHELAHVGACILFGMRVLQIKLFAPNRETGTLGFVNFAYNPRSTLHSVGLVVQGIAPLLMGFGIFIVIIPWGHAPGSVLSWLELTDQSPTYKHAIAGASALLFGNLVDGPRGFLWFLISLMIGLHAIPSWADIRIAGKGMITLLGLAIGFSALSQIDLGFLPPGIREAIYAILGLVLKGFFWGLEQMTYAVVLVTTVAVAAIAIFLLIPSLMIKLVRFIRGTPPAPAFAPVPPAAQNAVNQQAALIQALGTIIAGNPQGNPVNNHTGTPQQTSAVKSHHDQNIVDRR